MRWLARVKDAADTLLVCEVGRGLDILVATFVRDWPKVICYDYVGSHGRKLEEYFGEWMEIDFVGETSKRYPFGSVDEDVILIANETKIPDAGGKAIQENPHIRHIIRNGRLMYGRDG